jgi:hypothetical protein
MTTHIHIAGAILAGIALCGCAATTGNSNSKPTSATTIADSPNCLTDRDSRVPGGNDNICAAGRSYSNTEIVRTGRTNPGDALAALDPSVTVHH